MYPRTHLLGLARELRDLIYQHYVIVDGGYVHNSESGKLRTAKGDHVDLSLILACKQVACEMQGVHLGSNAVTFTTAYSDETRELAGHFNYAIEELDKFKARTLAGALCCVSSAVVDRTSQQYPQFTPLLKLFEQAREISRGPSWGETPSIHREFVASTLKLVSQHPDFPRMASRRDKQSDTRIADVLDLRVPPWIIPTREDVTYLLEKLNRTPAMPYYWDREKYRFSAAAMAIRFLHLIPIQTRLQLRSIVIDEDRAAVAYPECHIRGLVPFLQENDRLHIEQRVNIWRNAFVKGSPPLFAAAGRSRQHAQRTQCNQLNAWEITDSIKAWIMETINLVRHGMPSRCFNLVLDGRPNLDLASEAFDVVHRDAAYQAALDECFSRGHIRLTSWKDRRKYDWYRFEDFPAILADIVNKTSVIHCNFGVGRLWDVESIIEAHRRFTPEDWAESWQQQQPGTIQTIAPLPDWLDLRAEDAIPEDTWN